MHQKRLTPEEKERLQAMVLQGVAPEDISNFFGIAISSVHNFKKKMKDEGIVLANLRGRRPVGVDALAASNVPMTPPSAPRSGDSKFVTLSIKGVTIQIAKSTANFSIDGDIITIY
jgi:hypothetical protein